MVNNSSKCQADFALAYKRKIKLTYTTTITTTDDNNNNYLLSLSGFPIQISKH